MILFTVSLDEQIIIHEDCTLLSSFVLFVLEFYGAVNNEVMLSRSVNSGTVPGQV